MRVLHLIDSGLSGARTASTARWYPADLELRACRTLLQHASVDHLVVLFGPAAAARRAARLGVTPDLIICPPIGCPELSWPALRRLAKAVQPDVVQCWCRRTARMARFALRGIPLQRVVGDLLPPFDTMPAGSDAPAGVRKLLRNGGFPEDAMTLALIGRGEAADAQRFLYTLGSLQFSGINIVGLIPTWARQAPRAMRFARRFGSRIRFVMHDDPSVEIIAGADLALWDAPGSACADLPQSWFVAEAHALGVPVIAARNSGIEGLYPPAAAICFAANDTPPELARIAMPLIEDAALRQTVRREVQQHLASLRSADAFAQQMITRWHAAMEARPDTPALARRSKIQESPAWPE